MFLSAVSYWWLEGFTRLCVSCSLWVTKLWLWYFLGSLQPHLTIQLLALANVFTDCSDGLEKCLGCVTSQCANTGGQDVFFD